jgi:peptidoglycan/xylan/chitin deacetylase (PgdA/CDA1 family)
LTVDPFLHSDRSMRAWFPVAVAHLPTFVLGYHNVLPTAAFAGDGPKLPIFREQLRAMARRFAVVPLDREEAASAGRRPTLALTFDDGYRDNATLVADLLTEVGLPATFFVVTSFLDGTDYPWWERLSAIFAHEAVASVEVDGRIRDLRSAGGREEARQDAVRLCLAADLARRDQLMAALEESAGPAGDEAVAATRAATPMMTWADATALRDAGFAIGSHTDRHPILSREDPAAVTAELAHSKQRLEAELGSAVTTFAYPNGTAGDFDDTAVRLVREAGYRHAVTTVPGLNVGGTDPLRLRRLMLEPQLGSARAARWAATQLGGSAARRLLSAAPGARRALRTGRPSS